MNQNSKPVFSCFDITLLFTAILKLTFVLINLVGFIGVAVI